MPTARAQSSTTLNPSATATATEKNDGPDRDDDVDEILKGLDYPELQVVPRATERLQMEAEAERGAGYIINWMITVPALTTLLAASSVNHSYNPENVLTDKDRRDVDQSVQLAQVIGATGLIAGVSLPYLWGNRDGWERVRGVKERGKKGALLRERLAEESLEQQSHVMTLIRYGFGAANLLALAPLGTRVHPDDRAAVSVAVAVGLLPLFFPPRQVTAYRKQQEYKKKIYTPVAGLGVGWNAPAKALVPEYRLVWTF